MNESVESDALVMPSSTALPCAGRPPASTTRWFSSRNLNLSTTSSGRNSVSPMSSIFTQRIIWRADDFQVLVVDVDALQAVDFLDLVHQVLLQFLFAEHVQDVVRVARTVHQRIAGLHALAFLHVDVNAARACEYSFCSPSSPMM